MMWNMVVWSAVFLGTTRTNGIIKQLPEQITITEGGTAQLKCTYISKINDTKKPVGAFTWYKDEEHRIVSNKSSGFHGRVRTSSSARILSQSIQIVNVSMNDTGKYYCTAHLLGKGVYLGKGTQVTVTRNITTNGIIKQSPEQITITEGGTAQLNCTYMNKMNDTKKPVGAFTWYKDDEHGIVSNRSSGFHGRVRTSSSARILSQSIQIVNVSMNDTGKYYCTAHLLGKGVYLGKGTQVTVTRTTTAIGIIKQSPEQIMLAEGGTAQMNCTYISKINDIKKPVGAIIWYKDEENRTVCNSCTGFHGRVRTNSLQGVLSQSVQIINVRMNDTGKYYCRAHLLGKGVQLGKGAQVTVTPRNPTGFGRSLRWQMTEMGVKLAVFALINSVTVFGIGTWETYRALIVTNRANRQQIWNVIKWQRVEPRDP
ncbi:polymeric immunoglobulin receptor-like [Hemitrygon akajei]|uniref:polymeric immunoglobulin receptor-like n=1 Tax=Hemitrygon akajei TaxID=2704970 RepID=UPI003BFA07F9